MDSRLYGTVACGVRNIAFYYKLSEKPRVGTFQKGIISVRFIPQKEHSGCCVDNVFYL